MKPRSSTVSVSGIVTNVVKCGEISNDQLILIIPGNPGIIEFYEDFMSYLYRESGEALAIWGVSHAGHVSLPGEFKDGKHYGPFTLKQQIEHKVNFVREHIPDSTKLILIGHSIGCHIILEMMRRLEPDRVIQSLMLFPTIERMAVSPKGQIVTPLLNYFMYLGLAIVFIVSWLPEILKVQILKFILKDGAKESQSAIPAALNLFDPRCVYAALYMARDEMKLVVTYDEDNLLCQLPKLKLYFGTIDKWCPVSYYQEMKQKYPQADLYLCQKEMQHAFVLKSSKDMATIVCKWIKHA